MDHVGSWLVSIGLGEDRPAILTFEMVIIAGCTPTLATKISMDDTPYDWPNTGYQIETNESVSSYPSTLGFNKADCDSLNTASNNVDDLP